MKEVKKENRSTMRYLLLSVLVVCAIGTISMVPVALAYSGEYGKELEKLLIEAAGKIPVIETIEEDQIIMAEREQEREKIVILEWLTNIVILIVVPIALVILVVIAIKQYRRKQI
jgi:hypothetical protein